MNSRTAIAKIFIRKFGFVFWHSLVKGAKKKQQMLFAINNKFCRKWSFASPHIIQSAEEKSFPIMTTFYDLNLLKRLFIHPINATV